MLTPESFRQRPLCRRMPSREGSAPEATPLDAGEFVVDAAGPYVGQPPEGAPAPIASEQGAENPHASVVEGAPIVEADAADIAPGTEAGALDPGAVEAGTAEPVPTEPAIVDPGTPGEGSAVDAGQLPEAHPAPDAAQAPHTESTPGIADVPGAASFPDAVSYPDAAPAPGADPLPDAEQIPPVAAPVPVADQSAEAFGDESVVPEAVPFPAAPDVSANTQFVAATSAPLPHAEDAAAVHPDPSRQQPAMAEQAVAEHGPVLTPNAHHAQGPQTAPVAAHDAEPTIAASLTEPAATPVPDAEYAPAPHDEAAPLPEALAAHGEDTGPQPLQSAPEPRPDQSLGEFVAVEGSAPTAPASRRHLRTP